jgi:hypothetical protein
VVVERGRGGKSEGLEFSPFWRVAFDVGVDGVTEFYYGFTEGDAVCCEDADEGGVLIDKRSGYAAVFGFELGELASWRGSGEAGVRCGEVR